MSAQLIFCSWFRYRDFSVKYIIYHPTAFIVVRSDSCGYYLFLVELDFCVYSASSFFLKANNFSRCGFSCGKYDPDVKKRLLVMFGLCASWGSFLIACFVFLSSLIFFDWISFLIFSSAMKRYRDETDNFASKLKTRSVGMRSRSDIHSIAELIVAFLKLLRLRHLMASIVKSPPSFAATLL